MIEHYQNVLSDKQKDDIESLILKNDKFNWFMSKTLYDDDIHSQKFGKKYFDCNQLVHRFITNGEVTSIYTDRLLQSLDWINLCQKVEIPNNIKRLKTNLLFTNSIKKSNTPHIDYNFNHIVLLYYVNDSDGETTIYNKKYGDDLGDIKPKYKFKPKRGDFLKFDGLLYHSSKPPQKNEIRCVLNFNLI